MATGWGIDGVSASIAPYRAMWTPKLLGTDHNGAQVYSVYFDVQLTFPNASTPLHRQWIDIIDGGSHSIDALARDHVQYVTLSPVYLRMDQPPPLESVHSGEMIITIVNAKDNL